MTDSTPQLKVEIKGVVFPTWLAVCLLVLSILAVITLLLAYNQQRLVERELRILQLHCADIENVLIRQGVATRDDFAAWKQKGK